VSPFPRRAVAIHEARPFRRGRPPPSIRAGGSTHATRSDSVYRPSTRTGRDYPNWGLLQRTRRTLDPGQDGLGGRRRTPRVWCNRFLNRVRWFAHGAAESVDVAFWRKGDTFDGCGSIGQGRSRVVRESVPKVFHSNRRKTRALELGRRLSWRSRVRRGRFRRRRSPPGRGREDRASGGCERRASWWLLR
jgi:hypothetical protein